MNRSVPEAEAAAPVVAQAEDAEARAAGLEGLEPAAQARAVAAEEPAEQVGLVAPGAQVAAAEREEPEALVGQAEEERAAAVEATPIIRTQIR